MRRRTRHEEVRKLLKNFISYGLRVKIKLSMHKINLKLTRAPLRVVADKRTRV